jgi:hypothetical protein
MGVVVNIADFIGEFGISQRKPIVNGTSIPDGLISFIDREEKRLLMELMGKPLYDSFVLAPTDSVYDPLYEDQLLCDRYSEGLKTMLLCIIYYQYHKTKIVNSATGQKVNDSEVSNNEGNYLLNSVMYNRGVTTYNLIGGYLRANTSVYPLFEGSGGCCNSGIKRYIIL